MPDRPPPPSWPSSDSPDEDGRPHAPPPAPDLTASGGGRRSGDQPTAWPTPGQPAGPPSVPGGGPQRPATGPPEPREPRSRRRVVIAVAAVLLVVVGGVAVALLGGPGDAPQGTADAPSAEPAPDAPAGPTDPPPTLDPNDDGDLAPDVAAAHRELFTNIDVSERTMLALSAATPAATDDLDADQLADFEAEAAEHVAELERIHEELTSMDVAGSDEVSTIRDAYLEHLSAWIDWGRAVASDPSVVDRPDAAQPYIDAINFSADSFSSAVERNLDRSAAPEDVVDLADEIIQRGFSSDDDGTEI